jgi:hypothetical protein
MSFEQIGWYALGIYVITQVGVVAQMAVQYYLKQRKGRH